MEKLKKEKLALPERGRGVGTRTIRKEIVSRDADGQWERIRKMVGDMPARKMLPIAEEIERINNNTERGLALRKAAVKRMKLKDAQTLAGHVKAFTGDGLDLVLFAHQLLMVEDGEYRGWEVEMADKRWAVEFLADRGFGKAMQSLKVESTVRNASDEELIAEIKLLQEKMGGKVIDVNVLNQKLSGSGNANRENESGRASSLQGCAEGSGISGEDTQNRGV